MNRFRRVTIIAAAILVVVVWSVVIGSLLRVVWTNKQKQAARPVLHHRDVTPVGVIAAITPPPAKRPLSPSEPQVQVVPGAVSGTQSGPETDSRPLLKQKHQKRARGMVMKRPTPGPVAGSGALPPKLKVATTSGPISLPALTSITTPLPTATPSPRPLLRQNLALDLPKHDSATLLPTPMPATTPLPSATPAPTPVPTPKQNTAVFSSVRDSSGPSIIIAGRFLLVNQDEQMMYVYEDGVIVRSIPVSTGRPVTNTFTPAWRGAVGEDWGSGTFLDTQLWADYMWYLFPGPEGSILIHSVPYTRDGDQKIYDRLDALGLEPTSRGCVRISPEDAAWLKQWDPVDVPIQITPWSGKITLPTEPG